MSVAPMDQILKMRKLAMDSGFKSAGQRHHDAFTNSVGKSGWLNETTISFKSKGFDIMGQLELAPVGLRMLLHHKMPSIRHSPIPDVAEVEHIFDKTNENTNKNTKKSGTGGDRR